MAVSHLGRDFQNLFKDWEKHREVIFPRALWHLRRPASCHLATWCSSQSAQGYPHGDVHWVGALGTGSAREQRASRGKEAPKWNTNETQPSCYPQHNHLSERNRGRWHERQYFLFKVAFQGNTISFIYFPLLFQVYTPTIFKCKGYVSIYCVTWYLILIETFSNPPIILIIHRITFVPGLQIKV